MKKLFIALALILGSVLPIVFFNRNRLKLLYTSLNAFKDENLSYSFQHMAEIQPTNEIERSGRFIISAEMKNLCLKHLDLMTLICL